MNKKGFELAMSTLVIIIISIVILTGLIFLVTKGFGLWKESVEPLGNSASRGAIIEACNLACNIEDEINFCCNKFSLDNTEFLCTSPSLNVDCDISCASVSCPA